MLLSTQAADLRTWTDDQGRTVEAAFGGLRDGTVLLRLTNGSEVPFDLARLSAADQAYVKQQAAAAPAPAPAAGSPIAPVAPHPDRKPAVNSTWPSKAEVDTRKIEISLVSESAEERHYVYQSDAFTFTSQDKLAGSVMKEVARTFEATRALVQALPWGIVCEPDSDLGRFQAALYETRDDYIRNGGPTNSGGVYDSGDRIFKIPFPSLGLEMRGKTWFKNDNYRNDTLVHELTHQMMHDYLPFLPKWIIEGSAEYTESLPYNAGTFRVEGHKNAIKEHIDAMAKYRVSPDIPDLAMHMTMNRDQWTALSGESSMQLKLYFHSVLLVYFFNHLDGDGSGLAFRQFMDAVHDQVLERRAFFNDPRVKRMPGGRFTYPTSLKVPDMKSDTAPFKNLPVLLQGRDYATLAKQIEEGYRSIGVKLSVSPGQAE
ncbi:MAG: hypothetical protein KDK99_03075 [Verrucomicrobiales bacterium]|nr:hypothetical protein [Verrucomicrobiales bacterium]